MTINFRNSSSRFQKFLSNFLRNNMRYLIILFFGVALVSCSSGDNTTLKAENAALRVEVAQQRELAERAAADARMAQQMAEEAAAVARHAEAEAHEAVMEAERQREIAVKALEDCKGK